MTIVYEQLVSEPERIVRTLCGFLGLPFHAAMLQPQEKKHPAQDAMVALDNGVWLDPPPGSSAHRIVCASPPGSRISIRVRLPRSTRPFAIMPSTVTLATCSIEGLLRSNRSPLCPLEARLVMPWLRPCGPVAFGMGGVRGGAETNVQKSFLSINLGRAYSFPPLRTRRNAGGNGKPHPGPTRRAPSEWWTAPVSLSMGWSGRRSARLSSIPPPLC